MRLAFLSQTISLPTFYTEPFLWVYPTCLSFPYIKIKYSQTFSQMHIFPYMRTLQLCTVICPHELALPSCPISLSSICWANFHSPFKAQFLLLLLRNLPWANWTWSEALDIMLPLSLSFIAFNHSLRKFHTFILLYYIGNSFGQKFCLLSIGFLSYPRPSYSTVNVWGYGVDSKQYFYSFASTPSCK